MATKSKTPNFAESLRERGYTHYRIRYGNDNCWHVGVRRGTTYIRWFQSEPYVNLGDYLLCVLHDYLDQYSSK